MKLQKISELVKLPEFADFLGKYTPVCAAYVHNDDLKDILIGNRYNKDDPERDGYIVIPCGRLEDGESFKDAVLRETKEETDVDAEIINSNLFSYSPGAPHIKEYGPVITINNPDGTVWIFARDSGRRLTGKVFDIYPLSEPHETNSDLRDPRYEQLDSIIRNQMYVMPEERFILDILNEKMMRNEVKGRVHLDEEDFSGFMKESGLM